MLINHIKTAFRQARRSRLYTTINLAGLSAGIACCVLIFLFVSQELSYDRFHKNADAIYRVTTQQIDDGSRRQFAHAYLPLGPLLKARLPEVDEFVRMFPQNVSVSNKEIVLQEDICYADSNFFAIFSFALDRGNILSALNDPNNMVITELAAKRYFGNADPMGRELVIENKATFNITGVIKGIPVESSIRFDFLVPLSAARQVMGDWVFGERSWHFPTVYTYVRLKQLADIDKVEEKLVDLSKTDLPAIVQGRSHFLQPMAGVHFSSLENEPQPTMNKNILFLFIIVGIVILLLAAFNFVNLYLSRIMFRLKGVGIRKVLGASNGTIWWQTFTETILFFFCSLLLSVVWILIFLPAFNALMGKQLAIFTETSLRAWILIGILLLLIAFITSLIPSLILTRLKLSGVLKGKFETLFQGKRTLSLQSLFVVFQFTIAAILIIVTVIMQSQLGYMRDKDLGMQIEQTLVIPVRDDNIQNDLNTVKNELMSVNGVKLVSAISNFPWARGFHDFETTIQSRGKKIKSNASTLLVEEDFISVMGMKITKGRAFSKAFVTDAGDAFIMNETAASKFGVNDLSNVTITMADVASGRPKQGKLIGVVKDFHLQSLHEKVEPLILTIAPAPYYLDNIVVRLSGTNIPVTLKMIETKLKKISPVKAVDYFFLDDAFEKLYQKERRLASLFNYFSAIAIIIASMGLFGVVAFASARRTKEIGIRKVAGASTGAIIQLLSLDSMKLVILAIFIAIPIAWYLVNWWLDYFPYRVIVSGWVFVLVALAILLVAWLTMSLQTIRAAMANPVKSLRTE